MPELPQWRCLAQGQVTVHVDKNQCSYQQQLYIYAQHEWQYNVTLLCFTHGYIYTVLLRSILPTLVLSLTLWLFGFPRTACEPGRRPICYTQTHSRPQSPLCFPSRTTLGEKKPKTTTLSIPFITAVWATGYTTAPENVVKMMIQIHILQLTLLLPIFSTWFAVFRKRERRRVCQGACRNKDLQFGNCQCCLLTVNVPPFVYGMDMADVHSASWLYKVVLSSEFMREHYAFSSVLGLTLLLLPVLLCFPRCQGANTLTPRSSYCT